MIASFHLVRYPRDEAPAGMSRMGLDRPALRRVPGLRFVRQLGTRRGPTMTLSADLRRWALLAVWEKESALDAFLAGSPVVRRWADAGAERYDLRLRPVSSHGTWGRVDPFAGAPAAELGDRPVAILTHAAIRPTKLVAFHRAVPPPANDLTTSDGLLASVGIGELPVVHQGTLSLWRDLPAVRAYAYEGDAHREVVDRSRDERWYSSSLFARLSVVGAAGTWGGVDPLAA